MAAADDVTINEESSDRLCYRIVSAIAEERGVDVMDVDERLFEVVDTDALDRLLSNSLGGRDSDHELAVTFTIAGCEVEVTADRAVRATELNETRRSE